MVPVLLTSGETWFTQNSGWITPLAAALTAVFTLATAAVALYIGRKADKVATAQSDILAAQRDIEAAQRDIAVAQREIAEGQRTIAGLGEMSKVDEKMNRRDVLEAREQVASGFLAGSVEQAPSLDLLDLMEQVSIFHSERLMSIDLLTSLYSGRFICWWYAAKDHAEQYRAHMQDPAMWIGAEQLVSAMHVALQQISPQWSQRPSDQLMTKFFEDDLALVRRLLESRGNPQ